VNSERLAVAVAAWAEQDLARALHTTDRDVITATEAARWLVLDLFAPAAPARDLFTASARLGGLMAEAGASPSLAAGTIDSAVQALSKANAPLESGRVLAARASLLEGYVAAVRDRERAASCARWEYPACAVPNGEGSVAIACGHPSDDPEELADWAARLASSLVKAHVQRVVLSGPERARTEVANAVEMVGIEVGTASSRSWLRFPWLGRK
jgi:hypothetical protein